MAAPRSPPAPAAVTAVSARPMIHTTATSVVHLRLGVHRSRAARGRRGSCHAPGPMDAPSTDALRVEPAGDITSLREEWTALADRSGNIFATWELADAW